MDDVRHPDMGAECSVGRHRQPLGRPLGGGSGERRGAG